MKGAKWSGCVTMDEVFEMNVKGRKGENKSKAQGE
jgi:hypothetical protein